MNYKKRNKKIKKLTRVHIWPSVLFFLLAIFFSGTVFIGFLALMISNQLSERLSYTYANAISIIRTFDTVKDNEEDTIQRLQSDNIITDAIFILDKDDNVIAGYGEPTYNDGLSFSADSLNGPSSNLFLGIETSDKYRIYADQDLHNNLFSSDGDLHFENMANPEAFSSIFDATNVDLGAHVFETRFWVESEISDNRSVIVKCNAPLYVRDFQKSVLMGIIAFFAMLVPIVFFFINVIVSILDQMRLTKLLYTDTTTGGKSYIYFEQAAGRALRARRNFNKYFTVADVTIMKYRSYRNCHGPHAGEELLENVDKEITGLIGKMGFCAHTGKSSFVVFLKCNDRVESEVRIRTLIEELSQKIDDSCIVFHAGIYVCEPQESRKIDPADCLSHASAARASLTDENAAGVAVYDDKLLEEQLWRHKVEEKMQAALDNEEFKVYIQPKYNPVTEELAGAEALIRWINDEDGFISPGRFIPIFETNGFITKIDDYMISHVAKLQAEWLKQGKAVVPISVNVSRAHFANPDLAEHIRELVDRYEVPHNLIEIELTESAFFDDKAALLKTVHNLREMGFEISMDDFGAGYSSLNSLKDLPLDVLKLDADFFRGEDEESRGEIVVSQAIQLAKSLNMRIVAEGIEKKEQVDFLAGQGCDMIQGFYYAKPMPVDEYEQKL